MKKKFKKLIPYILIVLAIILLGIAISVVLQFTFKGEKLNLDDPENPVEEKVYTLDNQSSMNEDELDYLINHKRDDMMNFFDPIRYYNISDIDETYTEEDNEKYMVLTSEFTDNLRTYVTDNLYQKLVRNFEVLKTENDIIYYKVSKDEFKPLYSFSAIAKFDYTELEAYPIYASDERIDSIIKLKICDDEIYDLCRRNDDYNFSLVKENEEWLIDDIGIDEENDEAI